MNTSDKLKLATLNFATVSEIRQTAKPDSPLQTILHVLKLYKRLKMSTLYLQSKLRNRNMKWENCQERKTKIEGKITDPKL